MALGQQSGLLSNTLVAAAGINATLVQGSPTQMFGLAITNQSGTMLFVKFYDTAVASTSGFIGQTPIMNFGVPGNQVLALSWGGLQDTAGVQFANGLAFATTVNSVLTDQSGVAAGNLIININFR